MNPFRGDSNGEPIACALWRRLDTLGHDAARLMRTATGHELAGAAAFLHADGPARIAYRVRVDTGWTTIEGSIEAVIAGRSLRHRFQRRSDGWKLDDQTHASLAPLRDLDFGFTPAANLLQLRRVELKCGQSAELPVAWFDIGESELAALPQVYTRQTETKYGYSAPSIPYEAVLEMAPNGFVRNYPGLWMLEE